MTLFPVPELAALALIAATVAFVLAWNVARLVRAGEGPIGLATWAIVALELVLVAALIGAGLELVQERVGEAMREGAAAAGCDPVRTGVAAAGRSMRVRYEGICEIESNQLRVALLAQPKYQDPKRLAAFEQKTYSQFGEDGILNEIFARVGTTNRYFVEFGAADGMENNTVLLLRQGWGGLWMDGDGGLVARARAHFAPEVAAKRLRVEETFITAENIEKLFETHGVPTEFDLISIDIDRNDYHVWKAIRKYRPRVAVIEYNGIFPPGVEWVVDYKADAWWDGTSKAGTSLSALEALSRSKGYELVGCGTAGVNAFFVRKDLVGDKFAAPFTARNHHEPPRYWQKWGGHPRVP